MPDPWPWPRERRPFFARCISTRAHVCVHAYLFSPINLTMQLNTVCVCVTIRRRRPLRLLTHPLGKRSCTVERPLTSGSIRAHTQHARASVREGKSGICARRYGSDLQHFCAYTRLYTRTINRYCSGSLHEWNYLRLISLMRTRNPGPGCLLKKTFKPTVRIIFPGNNINKYGIIYNS